MTTPININSLITREVRQLPVTFPDNLDQMFEESLFNSEPLIPFRELPVGDYLIDSIRTFKTKDSRDCTVL